MGNYTLVLKMIFLLVFLAYLMVWILLPTKIYKNTWKPKLKSKLDSTYFGDQGKYLLLFSFPMMLIAALSCVYLHTQKKNQKLNSNSVAKRHGLVSWKRPVFIKAPLGIVNTVELAFALMFAALLIWSLAKYLHTSFAHPLMDHMHRKGEKVWQAKFRSVSVRLGDIGNTCWAFLFFPVTRGSSILPLLGLTSESSVKYHIWLGHLSNLLFVLHTAGFIIYWGMTSQMAAVMLFYYIPLYLMSQS